MYSSIYTQTSDALALQIHHSVPTPPTHTYICMHALIFR